MSGIGIAVVTRRRRTALSDIAGYEAEIRQMDTNLEEANRLRRVKAKNLERVRLELEEIDFTLEALHKVTFPEAHRE